ncbi:adenosylcobinamide amidohydrolase [Natrialba sp. INN-245]|uniref:adenosylcobinamide amidohydrolase n=1 Tax=Natrialba sp. INN-245 TaxID=2690967 RepID=UPI0013121FF2|nr:adenosylcobinamide amidohydrolase [Natrialba sp. INN-245]
MTDGDRAYRATRRDGVLRVGQPGAEWFSSGWNGGRRRVDCAYNVSVPDGWNRTDLESYADDRLERAEFGRLEGTAAGYNRDGSVGRNDDPLVLFTGVDLEHARGARRGSVTVYATAGISNPAALPMDPVGGSHPTESDSESAADPTFTGAGTVNLIVGTTRALAPGALANLLAVAVEAKTTTLLGETGFPGTTTDAVVVGHDPDGSRAEFSGSATPVGAATRACVREAVRASLRSRYGDGTEIPESVADAEHGISTDRRARVFRPLLEGDGD